MKIKQLLLSFIAVFLIIFLFDWFFHGRLLMDLYHRTASLWRTQEDMCGHFHWLVIGQAITALFISIFYIKGCPCRGIRGGICFGITLGLLFSGSSLIQYAVSPIPMKLAIAWSAGHIAEFILAGIALAVINRSEPAPTT